MRKQEFVMVKRKTFSAVKLLFIVSATFTVIFFFVGCATVPIPERPGTVLRDDYSVVKTYASSLIEQEMKKNRITGLSIALVDDQRVVWSSGFGYADKSRDIKATADTMYFVGSISKLFTATAVMQLAEKGMIDIDAPVQTYLPELRIKTRFPNAGPVTIRGMLTHHSGMPSDYYKGWVLGMEPSAQDADAFMELAGQLGDEYIASPPDRVMSYSNLSYSLLGAVVSRVSGEDFPGYVDRHILEPLGMTRSSFLMKDKFVPYLSEGYLGRRDKGHVYIRDLPAGSFLSSANDLARFMMMTFSEGRAGGARVLKSDTLSEMLRPQNTGVPLDLDFRIGLCYWLSASQEFDSVRVASHGGDIYMFHAMLSTLPDQRLGVAVLSNSATSSVAVSKVASEVLKLAYEVKTGIRLPDARKADIISPDEEEMESIAGFYAGSFGLMEVRVKNGSLKMSLFGMPLDLIARADGTFSLDFKLLGFIPIDIPLLDVIEVSFREIEGKSYMGYKMEGVTMGVAEKFEPEFVPEIWRKRAGNYSIIDEKGNPDRETRLFIRKAALTYDSSTGLFMLGLAVQGSKLSFPLSFINNSEAVTKGEGRNLGETVRAVERGGDTYIYYSGLIFKQR
jgi:CubicO group peptidase (beta-lactamase class C family)